MNSLGTPDTSFRGLSTLTVLRVDKSGPDAFPVCSSVGINIGKYLVTSCFQKSYYVNIHRSLPRHNHNKVHDVPGISEVRVRMEDEAHGHDLGAHLHGEDPEEVGLQLVLGSKKYYIVYTIF